MLPRIVFVADSYRKPPKKENTNIIFNIHERAAENIKTYLLIRSKLLVSLIYFFLSLAYSFFLFFRLSFSFSRYVCSSFDVSFFFASTSFPYNKLLNIYPIKNVSCRADFQNISFSEQRKKNVQKVARQFRYRAIPVL